MGFAAMIQDKVRSYHEMFLRLLSGIDLAVLSRAAMMVQHAYTEDRQIFTAGNGGSASLALHLAADFGKNVAGPEDRQPRIQSLCANSSTITALGNDCGFENIFAFQLRNFMNPKDLVILISSSGNSPNVIKAAEYARTGGAQVLTMTGFGGGRLKELADVSLHIPCDIYELVEDVHSFFCHAIVHTCKRPRP